MDLDGAMPNIGTIAGNLQMILVLYFGAKNVVNIVRGKTGTAKAVILAKMVSGIPAKHALLVYTCFAPDETQSLVMGRSVKGIVAQVKMQVLGIEERQSSLML